MYRILIVLLLPFFLFAKEKICLNMIVKDEKDVIKRCLDSVKPHIDYWVIVDTGSKDGTQKIIKNHMKGIPGKLIERPWKNWGETRTEALKLAQEAIKGKCDYILFMDADDALSFDPGCTFQDLHFDLYNMWRGSKGFTYLKPQLAKASLPWKWVGVTHEYLTSDGPHSSAVLENVRYLSLDGGATWKDTKKKFMKNVELLEAGLKKEPENSRYAFYLAESYRDAGEKAKALEWYQKRIKMGGWAEETFWSMLQVGHMLKELGLPNNIITEAYLNAYCYRPHRPEGPYFLAEMYNEQGRYDLAYELLRTWQFIPQPEQKDSLFNMDWIQEYGHLFQLSICSYYVGNYEECLKACDKLLTIADLPKSWHKRAQDNRVFPLEKLELLSKNPKPLAENLNAKKPLLGKTGDSSENRVPVLTTPVPVISTKNAAPLH